MGVGRTPYLIRRQNRFYFRMALPADIAGRSGKPEFKVSLRTSDLTIAKRRCQELSYTAVQLISLIRHMPKLTADEIKKLSREFFLELLKQGNEQVYFYTQDNSLKEPLAEAIDLEANIDMYNAALMGGEHRLFAKTLVNKRLAFHGVQDVGSDSEEFDTLARNFIRAKVESLRITQAKLRGEYASINPRDPLFEGITTDEVPVIDGEFDPNVSELALVIVSFIDFKSAHEWSPKTKLDYLRVLRWFADAIGSNTKLEAITKKDISDFQKALYLVPSGFEKMPEFKGHGFKFASENGADLKKFSPKTISKYFDMLKSFFLWCL